MAGEGGTGAVPVLAAGAGGITGLGLPALSGVMAAMEAGVPVPVPFDLLLLVLGERTAAGRFSLVAVVLALEVVAVVGTTALFLAVRGPGRAVLARVGPNLGLTEERRRRAAALLERRGRTALAVGRATPGLRTITVAAAGTSPVRAGRALPALILGSSVFLQLHLVLGYTVGPVARDAIEEAKGPAIAVLLLVAVAGVVFWLRRRGRRAGTQAAAEACCPACLALGVLAPKAFALDDLEPTAR